MSDSSETKKIAKFAKSGETRFWYESLKNAANESNEPEEMRGVQSDASAWNVSGIADRGDERNAWSLEDGPLQYLETTEECQNNFVAAACNVVPATDTSVLPPLMSCT
jgi:hypothetical protein